MTDLSVTKRKDEVAKEERVAERPARGGLTLASCRSGQRLARQIVERLRAEEGSDDLLFLEGIDDRFSDSETVVRLDADVSGKDVFLLQALYDPTSERGIDENYMAFFIAARACRE